MAWKPCKSGFLGPDCSGKGYLNVTTNGFILEGIDICAESPNSTTYINVWINNFTGPGSYILGDIGLINRGIVGGKEILANGNLMYFETDQAHFGSCTITDFDAVKQRISGTFEFDAYNLDSNRISTVRQGIFINITYTKI